MLSETPWVLEGGELKTIEQVRNEYIVYALKKCNYNIVTTSNKIGVSRATIYRILKKMNYKLFAGG